MQDKVAIVRGKYLNNFEMQNYFPLKKDFDITAFSSFNPIHNDIGFHIKRLFSPLDLPNFSYKMPILNRLFVDAMYLLGLEKKLRGFDLVCVRETYFHFTQQALKAKKRGWVKKILVTCSETIPFNHEGIWGRRKFKKNVYQQADHFHCLTKKSKQCLIEEGVDPKKITVIGYGIDLKRFKNQKHSKIIEKNNKLTLLFVGRLVKEKGVEELLEAFTLFYKENPLIRLKIVGTGKLLKKVMKIQKILPRNAIDFLGKVDYCQMSKIYQRADIFVLPSKKTRYWEEYYGMVLLEAMASGLPVITTNCGAIPEVVGKSAYIIPSGNSRELYLAIKKFVNNKNLRLQFGQRAFNYSNVHFNCQKQALKLGNLWRQIIKV